MQFRSHFLAAASLSALLREITKSVTPKLDRDNPDFTQCWKWTGLTIKPLERVQKLRRMNNTTGEHWELRSHQELERPRITLGKPIGTVDARRLVFELFDPESGLYNYRLYRLPNCQNPLCVNPKHFERKIAPVSSDHDYPVYIERQSPFSAHLIGSYHPHRANIIQDLNLPEQPKNSLKIDMLVSQQVTEPPPVPIQIQIQIPPTPTYPDFGNGFGKILERGEFTEIGELEVCNVKAEWQAFTTDFVSNAALPIQNWLGKWSDVVPSTVHGTVNLFSVECVKEAFEALRKEKPKQEKFKLSELLEMEKYWFHPRLIMDWYSGLSLETKEKIFINQ